MKFKIFIFFALLSTGMLAQTHYGNEWINYSQTYFKFPIVKDGIYRISQTTLFNAGLNNIDPRNIQIFARGKEIPLYIKNDAPDFLFDANDYIEFYAEKNSGWLDSSLYDSPNNQANPYYSQINDTIFYFLTSNTSFYNLRYQTEADVSFPANPLPYCIKESLNTFTTSFIGLAEGSPYYTPGEGWFDDTFSIGAPVSKVIATPNIYSSGPPSTISYSISSISNANTIIVNNTSINHHLRVQLNSVLLDTTFFGYAVIKKNHSFATSSLSPQNTMAFSIINEGLASDICAVSYAAITYPHTYDFEHTSEFLFTVPVTTDTKSYLQISNFNGGSDLPVLYDLTSRKRITLVESGNKYHALVPNTSINRKCILAAQSNIALVSQIFSVGQNNYFTDYSLEEQGSNSKYLIITHPLLWSAATDYKNYRISKGLPSALINIIELYDQFSYGINKHPLSIKNFLNYALHTWDSIPEYLFLIGKSIQANSIRKSEVNYANTFIPSMGNPPSDILFSAGLLDSGTNIPALAIGRLSALNPQQVTEYLDKVKEHESNSADAWMKNIIHFGGGSTITQQTTFQNYLNSYKIIIEAPLFAGNVTSFFRTGSEPIQITHLAAIENLINTGTSLITFFGHAAATTFDQSIEDPQFFNNKRKYPFMLANACFVGDIHRAVSAGPSLSERWVLIKDHGAIGFLASIGSGYDSYLNGFSSEFYKQISLKNYGKSVGTCIKETMKYYLSQSSDPFVTNTCLELALHGDPAVHINTQPKPDLVISSSSLSLNPSYITTETDSFNLKIVTINIGMAATYPYLVVIKRTYPDNSTEAINKIVDGCNYSNTLFVKIPVDQIKGVGLNKIDVRVDAMDSIDELSETNNNASISFIISSSDIIPVYPYKYAIYPNETVTLKASTGNPFAGTQNYTFEIDTNDLFLDNSPFKRTGSVTQSGGVVTWAPPLTLSSNTVYYWRVTKTGSSISKESSFIYIPGKTGWSQAHFFQFKNDDYQWIDYIRDGRRFDFIQTPQDLTCRTIGLASNYDAWLQVHFRINGIIGLGLGDVGSCGASPKVQIAVIDPLTIRSWLANSNDFGQSNYPLCSSHYGPDSYFLFPSDIVSLSAIPNLISAVPNGYYILAYTFVSGNFESWPDNAKQAFDSLGATVASGPRNLGNNIPWIFFCQKGNPGSIKYEVGLTPYDTLDLSAEMQNNFYKGGITSELIGPANHWDSLHWNSISIDPTLSDSVNLVVTGIKSSGTATDLFTLPKDSTDINLNSRISAATYPFMKLNLITKDSIYKTPSQLKKWQIIHSGIPETAINPQKGFYFYKDTVNEGDNIVFSVAFENISPYNMDSLLIRYWVQDKNNNLHKIKYKRLRPHPAEDIIKDTVRFNTMSYPGLNSIWVEANPIDTLTGNYDQLEQYHFNNIAQKFFYVNSDKANPLLDVTFDGVHILDGDIVSAKPEIVVQLKDENKYLALNDSSLFAVYLTSLSTSLEHRVYFKEYGTEKMKFVEAQLPKNSCKIYFNPEFSADGKYLLRIQAKDRSNNESGKNDLTISFEVITKSTITEIFNYPNPFSTATKFVFTLTGFEVPTDFRIQILTVTGKLAKTITLSELGNIHVGRNITDYTWDGKDDFGDKLANGVYFYHVITSINGKTIEKRTTEADKYFKHGFGKLYIMR